jgi:hypothetical protein
MCVQPLTILLYFVRTLHHAYYSTIYYTLCITGKDYSGPSCCQNGFSCQDYAIDYKRCLPGQGEIETTYAPPPNSNGTSSTATNETPSTPGDMTAMVCGEAGQQCGGRGKSYTHYTYIYICCYLTIAC